MSKYCIEINGKHNENVKFSPSKAKVRGRWSTSNIANREQGEAMRSLSAAAEYIPGQCIFLDTSAKIGKITEPLRDTPEGRDIWKRILAVMERYKQTFSDRRLGEERVFNRLSIDDVKLWAFHMRTLIESGLAHHAPGSDKLPDADEIRDRWPGVINDDPLRRTVRSASGRRVDAATEGKAELAGAGAGSGGNSGDGKK